MKAASLKFWGVRGSIPSPGGRTVFYGGNTSCVEVRVGDEIIILDAGTGIRGLGKSLELEFKNRPIAVSVLITHTHWDHIQGFPFFIPAYNARNSVTIYGFEGARQGLQSALSVQMDSPYFPVSLEKMPGQIQFYELKNLQFKVGSVPVHAQFLNHPGVCTGYRIFTRGGSICYLPDVELFPEHIVDAAPNDATDSGFPGTQNEKLIEFIRGAEVVVMDSQYNVAEYHEHSGWGHSCVADVVAVAVRAGDKRLYLFHHDPDHSDEDVTGLVEHARQTACQLRSPILIEAAREGLEAQIEASEPTAGTLEQPFEKGHS